MDPLVGRSLGPYELLGRLGAGGMGTVYRAVHRRLRQQRAVKVLPSHLAADPTFVQRFEREARLAAELRHANIVVVHDVDEADGVHFIAMELLQGRSLRDVIQQEAPFPVERALALLDQLASALDFAHQRGVIHRDVKPANIFVGAGFQPGPVPAAAPAEHLTLVDFGIARAAEGTVLTASGIVGTPEYMAPEMLRGEAAGASTDLYALGVVAYELLAGRMPFTGTNTPAIMYAHVHYAPPPLRGLRPDLPPAVEAVIARQLAKRPEERYPTAGAFVAALRDAVRGAQPPTFHPDGPLLAHAGAALAAGDWQTALQDLARASQPASPAAAELRRQAEALRTGQGGQRTGPTPGPISGQWQTRPAPVPPPPPSPSPSPTPWPAPAPTPSPSPTLSPRLLILAAVGLVLLGVLGSVGYGLLNREAGGERRTATATPRPVAGVQATATSTVGATVLAVAQPTPVPPTATVRPPTATVPAPSPTPVPPTATRVRPTPTLDEGPSGREMPDEGVAHVDEGLPVTHMSRPPTSGMHYPQSYPNYGVFDRTLPIGSWLHNVEHGAIAILYNCPEGCPEIEQQLKNLYPTLPLGRNSRQGMPRFLIFPYRDMDTRIAVVTWRWLLELDTVDTPKIVQFAEEHLDRAWECNASTRVCPFP